VLETQICVARPQCVNKSFLGRNVATKLLDSWHCTVWFCIEVFCGVAYVRISI